MSTQPPLLQEQSVFLTVWDDAWAAITKPRLYVKWAVQPVQRSLAYISIIFTAMALISTIYAVLIGRPQWQKARPWIIENVPQLTMAQGQLSIADNKTFAVSDRDVFVRVDTSDVIADLSFDPFYEHGVMVAADGALVRTEGQTDVFTYQELKIPDFVIDGAGIVAKIDGWLRIVLVALPFLVFAFIFITNIVYTALFSLFVTLVSGFTLPFKPVWSMSLYALTPSLLTSYILFVLYPVGIVSTVVFVVYMVLAVNNFKRFLQIKNSL